MIKILMFNGLWISKGNLLIYLEKRTIFSMVGALIRSKTSLFSLSYYSLSKGL